MVPADDFQRKIDSLLAVQAHHDEQIQALIRVAELQQSNLDQLDDTVAEMAQSFASVGQSVAGVGQSVASLSQTVGTLGQTVASVSQTVGTLGRTVGGLDRSVERSRIEMLERQKYLDERVDRLVSAIGELARRQK
jgi:DNA anti-recombination protein RmuC